MTHLSPQFPNHSQIYGLLPTGILAFWPPSLALKEFAFLTAGVQLMTAVLYALLQPFSRTGICLLTANHSYTWANEVCADDNEQRALVIGSMNGFQYAVAAWLPILTFPQLESPTFRKGFPTSFGLVIAAILCVLVIQLFVVREQRAKRLLTDRGSDSDFETRTSDTVRREGEEKTHEPRVVVV